MKLLFVHHYLGAFGGAEATIALTARQLVSRGHEVDLLFQERSGKGEAEWELIFRQKRQVTIGTPSARIRNVVEDLQPDALFVHNLKDLECFETLARGGIPIVRMMHDHALYCLREYKYNYLTRAICTRPASGFCVFPCLATVSRNRGGRRLFPLRLVSYSRKLKELSLTRGCDKAIVYSNYCRRELVNNGFNPAKIHTYSPVAPLREPSTASFGPKNLVLFAGQIIRGKGVDVLLKALAKVQVPFECVILGEGSHRRHCERLCRRLGLASKVRFEGYVSPDQMRQFYLGASVFAVSSVWPEPFGLVGPEAMRYGLPVVGFDAGGIREWLLDGENGFLVPWMESETYARRIELLLTNKLLARQLGQNGRARVAREYDPARQVGELERIFFSLTRLTGKPIDENAGLYAAYGPC